MNVYEKPSNIRFIGSFNRIVPWRFSFLMPNINTLMLCDVLRNERYDISTWYPNLANMFVSDNKRKLENANIIENSVVNLWLDESKDEQDVFDICSRIMELSSNQELLNNDKGIYNMAAEFPQI